jgi:hypothetical protein
VDAGSVRKRVGAPTTALFGCTAKPVICDTIFEAATICVVSMPTSRL